jgi:hypothetical protein
VAAAGERKIATIQVRQEVLVVLVVVVMEVRSLG